MSVIAAIGGFINEVVKDVEVVFNDVEAEATAGIQWVAQYGPQLAQDVAAIETALAGTVLAAEPEVAAFLAALPGASQLITKLAGAASTIVTNATTPPPAPPSAA